MKAWLILIAAGILEMCWAVGMKYSAGFTRLWPSIFTITTTIGSFVLLSIAMRSLPLGTAYAIWTGIGAMGTAIFGMIYFGDAVSYQRIICLLMIASGIIGLKIFH